MTNRSDAWSSSEGPQIISAEEYVRAAADAMTEAVLQVQVERAMRALGWRYFHAPDNRPGGKAGRVQRVVPGFPDLCAVSPRQRRVLYAELKKQDGRVSADQAAWHADLRACGQEVYVWRPIHLLDGTIVDTLNGTREQ